MYFSDYCDDSDVVVDNDQHSHLVIRPWRFNHIIFNSTNTNTNFE